MEKRHKQILRLFLLFLLSLIGSLLISSYLGKKATTVTIGLISIIFIIVYFYTGYKKIKIHPPS